MGHRDGEAVRRWSAPRRGCSTLGAMSLAGPTTARAARSAPVLRKALKRSAPSLDVERQLWAEGHEVVVGIDEVGRGAWAGPLTLGAAVVPKDRRVNKIRDSKMLTEREREALFNRVSEW